MGETSKKIGEIGENIVENFFKLIGWNPALSNQELPCSKNEKHAKSDSKTGKRETHGIDFLYSYRSPLESSTAESAIISVKHSANPYGNNPKSTFKKHALDLIQALECYKHSEIKKQQQSCIGKTTKTRDTGVLFWLSSSEETYDDVVSKISNTKIDQDYNFESFHVIDNQRINFIYDTIKYIKNNHNPDSVNYYYPETSLSYVDKSISRHGKIFPIEFLTSPLIPIIIKANNNTEQDIFCLSSSDPFSKDILQRLIHAAKEYTQDMSCNLLFLFPNYLQHKHESDVKIAALAVEENIYSRISVKNYKPDYRSLSND